MSKSQPELEFLLGSDDDVIGDFIRHVANEGLTRYKSIIQWGGKAGEPLYAHVVNGVFVAETLRPLLQLTDEESRVLFSAFPVHDLNKMPDSAGKSFNRVTTPQAVQKELESIGIPGFFPEYMSYLEDITLLVRSHPGHYHTSAEWLVPAHHPYKLSRERLDLLRDLMRALDILELSTTLEETTHKQSFLSFLNAHAAKSFDFVYHKVHEQRGLLTNIIHNRVKDHLSDHFSFIPLLFYPDGTAYLREQDKGGKVNITAQDMGVIGDAVAQSAAGMTRDDFGKFITPTNQGIKVDVQCLELGISFVDILGVIHSQVMAKVRGRRFAIGDKSKKDVETKCRSDLEEIQKDSSKKDLLPSIEQLLQRSRLMPQTQERMGAGELLLAHYIFLNKHFKHQIKNTWSHLYGLLGITSEQAPLYAPLDSRYQRAYVIANDLQLTVEGLLPIIQEDGAKFMPVTQTESVDLGTSSSCAITPRA